METNRTSALDLGAVAWGAFFILWGITELFPSLPEGTFVAGIGAILLGVNLVRLSQGRPVDRFTATLGALALLLGALLLAGAILSLPFELPVFAVMLIALGAIFLGRAAWETRSAGAA